ncbi:MAG: non-canonical purine pyrophosphatase, rdgB/HAM1 family [Verrucomicrobiales bacterium]|nr:non-canonical purine pyrophosphatase, rdgB/HAM1 family [Verrucomicrobiales bacterium]
MESLSFDISLFHPFLLTHDIYGICVSVITLVIATRNSHKVEEIRDILGKKYRYLTLNDFPSAPLLVEDGNTFVENAKKKAVGLAHWLTNNPKLLALKLGDASTQLYFLADDSGLEVDALGGAPGVHSARFAALDTGIPGNSPDSLNNLKLMKLMQAVASENRAARFRCVIALTKVVFGNIAGKALISTPEGLAKFTETYEGACEGQIALEKSGKGGFGYDSLFIPAGYGATYADLSPKIKNKLSHRAQALQKVRTALKA